MEGLFSYLAPISSVGLGVLLITPGFFLLRYNIMRIEVVVFNKKNYSRGVTSLNVIAVGSIAAILLMLLGTVLIYITLLR